MKKIKQPTIDPSKISGLTRLDLLEEQLIFYRDHLDVFIEDQFYPIKLTREQHVIARQFGRADDVKVVCSRGFGKTWLIALCCIATAALYPGTPIAVCSATAPQATLILGKIKELADQNANIANELSQKGQRSLVVLSKDSAKCTAKNGSTIESFALNRMRGIRTKVVVVDEARDVDIVEVKSVVDPTKNFRRANSYTYDFQDFQSKTVMLTSACEKQNPFYNDFMRTMKMMAKGDRSSFCCALNYKAAVDGGVTDEEFFDRERERNTKDIFDMEYGSIFGGSSADSFFPFDLTQTCRNMEHVEIEQPKGTTSRYVISLDIATSKADGADNAVISVLKFSPKLDGSFDKKLVYIRSFHGQSLDILAREMRKTYHMKFPSAERLIYDARGIGDSFSKFLDTPWFYMGKEYPALVEDDVRSFIPGAKPVLHAVRAVQTINQRMAMRLRVAFEKRSIEMPMTSRLIQAKLEEEGEKSITMEELAVFKETDALQAELGNVCQHVSASGNFIFDTVRSSEHKDRYSSFAMALDYVIDLEEKSIAAKKKGPACIGIASKF